MKTECRRSTFPFLLLLGVLVLCSSAPPSFASTLYFTDMNHHTVNRINAAGSALGLYVLMSAQKARAIGSDGAP